MGKGKNMSDLPIGEKFGKLTVIGRSANLDRNRHVKWECLCECGNTKEFYLHNLKKCSVKSCGCEKRKKRIDLQNRKYGCLTVLESTLPIDGEEDPNWKCRCECGVIIEVSHKILTKGNIKSCGCSKASGCSKEGRGRKKGVSTPPDISGQVFGKLTVIDRAENTTPGKARWNCICECGEETIARASSLRSGHTLSCGCLQRSIVSEKQKERVRQYNERKRSEPNFRGSKFGHLPKIGTDVNRV
ncbi:MAG: hypothetical protein JKX76_15470 [Colwellia sp.]|nr:hypothetical protein [Colwellia sp.]